MSARIALLATALVLVGAAGCLREPTVCEGPGGLVCPHGTVCSSAGTCLVEPDACGDFADGVLCADGASICRAGACVVSSCGDGFLDPLHGEACDDGAANSDVEPGACRKSCQLATCGDGVLDPGEAPWCLGVRSEVDAPAKEMRLARADLDDDGEPDVVASYLDGGDAVLAWWRVTADGRLGAPETLWRHADASASAPPPILAADLDGDGHVDLALAAHDVAGDARVELLTRTSGAWAEAARLDVPGFDVTGLASGDVDGDHVVDLIVASSNGPPNPGNLVLCRGSAGMLPAMISQVVPAPLPLGLDVGDLDGDDLADVVLTSGPDEDEVQALGVFWGGNGLAADPTVIVANAAPVIDDVVADREADLIYATTSTVVLAHGTGGSATLSDRRFGAAVHDLAVLDVDGNTWPDVAALDTAGLTLYSEPGDLARHVELDLQPSRLLSSPARRDELVVLGTHAGTPRLALLRAGDGLLTGSRPAFVFPGAAFTAIQILDLDLDGAPDLLMDSFPAGYDLGSSLQQHDGPTGNLTFTGPLSIFGPPLGFATGDLDGDGHADIIGLDRRGPGGSTDVVRVLSRHGSMLVGLASHAYPPVAADAAAVLDVDQDGHADLVLVDKKGGQVSWLGNPAGDGVLADATPAGYLMGAQLPLRRVEVADLDGDGVPEVIGLDAAGDLQVWRGSDALDFGATPLTRHDVVSLAIAPTVTQLPLLVLVSADGAVDVVSLDGGALVSAWHGEVHALDAGLADLDGDGGLDLVTLGEALEVRRHLPGPGFAFAGPESYLAPAGAPRHLRLGDVDGDGTPDVVLFDVQHIDWLATRRTR